MNPGAPSIAAPHAASIAPPHASASAGVATHRASCVWLAALAWVCVGCGPPAGGPLRVWHDEATDGRDPSRGRSFASVVAQIARETTADGFRLRAIPITPAYLWAFHLRRANADLVEPATARQRLQRDLARYARRHTSFVVTLRFAGPRPLTAGEPALDLRAWRFRLRDGLAVVREPVTVQPYESARETDSERASLLSPGDEVVFEHVVRGALRFRHRLRERARQMTLEASPPALGTTLRVTWLLSN